MPLETRRTTDLCPHPKNAEIYGDGADDELVKSIADVGVLVPLLVTPDGVIVGGHRRWEAARQLGLPDVPVVVFPCADEWKIREALVLANRQRTKTKEQLGREGKELLAVEQHWAWLRQVEHGGTAPGRPATLEVRVPQVFDEPGEPDESDSPPELDLELEYARDGDESGEWPDDEPPPPAARPQPPKRRAAQSRDAVAAKLGVSGRHIEKAMQVVEVLDELLAASNTQEAEQLRDALNLSVRAGYERARQAGYIKSARQPPPPDDRRSTIDAPAPPALIDSDDALRPAYERAGRLLAQLRERADLLAAWLTEAEHEHHLAGTALGQVVEQLSTALDWLNDAALTARSPEPSTD